LPVLRRIPDDRWELIRVTLPAVELFAAMLIVWRLVG